jgi:hypothetical protein
MSRRVRLFNQDTKVQALKRAPLFEGSRAGHWSCSRG